VRGAEVYSRPGPGKTEPARVGEGAQGGEIPGVGVAIHDNFFVTIDAVCYTKCKHCQLLPCYNFPDHSIGVSILVIETPPQTP
jgi:hypothetical protein